MHADTPGSTRTQRWPMVRNFCKFIQVANGAQLLKICRESGRAIRKAPWHFLLLQAPEAGFDIVEKTLTPLSESSPFLALLIILPLVWLLSALSISLTFASVQRMRK